MLQLVLLIYLIFGTIKADGIPNENIKVCENEQCKLAADIINKSMNKTINPCDDFYNYVCGNWKVNYPLPDDENVWNLEKITENNAILEVKGILDEEEDKDDITPLKYEKWFYKQCMDEDNIEETGIRSLEEFLDSLGGWPIAMNVSEWTDEGHDWQTIHEYYLTFKELSSLFDVNVSVDDRNFTRNAIMLNKPTQTLYDELLMSGQEVDVLPKYTNFIKAVVLTFIESANKSISDDDIDKDVEDIVTFEKTLRQIKVAANESEDLQSMRTYMSIKDLQQFYDDGEQLNPVAKINWFHVFTVVFDNLDNTSIDDGEDIGIEDTLYLRKLSQFLNETPNRVIVNYIHWKFMASSIKYANKELRDLLLQLTTDEEDENIIPERWEQCILDIKLGIGYRYTYIKRHLSEETKKMTSDISSEVRSEMLDEVERSTWLDDNTKEETMIKLHALKWHVGASNFFARTDFIEHIYDELTIASNYFENIQNIRKYLLRRNLKRLRHKRHPHNNIRVDPLEVRSLYDPSRNIIMLTTTQLSVPLLHASLPLSINYGYIAPTLGQLMSRTMEKEVNSNIYIAPWSTYLGDNYKSYEIKTECLIRQYYNYSVGPSTVDDNIYDAIGLKVAYNAFQNSFYNENVEKLPDLEELNDNQLFFVSFAMKYCESTSENHVMEQTSAVNTPNEFRVIGTLVNSPEFATTFNCPLNSPMNPENKCII